MAKKSQLNNPSNPLMKFRGRKGSAENGTASSEEQSRPRYLTTDTSIGHVLTMIVLRVCRRITCDISFQKRFLAYLLLIVVGGILGDFAPVVCRALMPIRTTKDSIMNQLFVKIGWFWTLVLTTPFVILTSEVVASCYPKEGQADTRATETTRLITTAQASIKDKVLNLLYRLASKDMTRIVVNTLLWYFSTNTFLTIEGIFGSCAGFPDKSQAACYKSGGKWIGFDISGHTFILLFSTLTIIEEVTVMVGWEPFGHELSAEQQHFTKNSKGDHRQYVVYKKHLPAIRVLFVCLTILCLIWDFMLLQTALFYHTMVQKAIAGLWAVGAWFITYRVLYKSEALSAIVRPPTKPRIE